MRAGSTIKKTLCHGVPALVSQSGLIVTATTSETPVLPEDPSLLAGRHFIGLGANRPEVRECPDALFLLLERLYIDTDAARTESGDMIAPLQSGRVEAGRVQRLGSAIAAGTVVSSGTTFFKSVGMAITDVFSAQRIYERALETGCGQQLI